MFPVLFSFGSYSVTTFGLFLVLAFLASSFTIWRLCRFYDIDEEKTTNLVILTFFGGFIGARVYVIVTNWNFYNTFYKAILFTKYPGLSFWGGLLGGFITFLLLSKRSKLNFWQIADFASVGVLLGMILGEIGCFFGGCEYGVESNLPFSTSVVGLLGKRLPISLFEALAFFLVYLILWRMIVRFHFAGKIVAYFFIFLGVIKFITGFFRGDTTLINISYRSLHLGNNWFTYGQLFALITFFYGWIIFYRQGKRNFINDISWIWLVFISPKARRTLTLNLRKICYNYWVSWRLKLAGGIFLIKKSPKVVKRRLNVASTPTHFR